MKLIIFSGPPGAGKSKLADYASRKLCVPILAKDWIEATLWQNGIKTDSNSGAIAYDILTSLAEEQLERNVSVILDSVATTKSIRDTWRSLAKAKNIV
jgi:predicted kinase